MNKENKEITVKVKRIHPQAKLPHFAHPTDACADIFSVESFILEPGRRKLVATGLELEIPVGYEGQVRPRSGLAAKHGILVVNSPGTIDAGYRGEVKVILQNSGRSQFKVKVGDRVAQIAIRPIPSIRFVESKELTQSRRGKGGFGSTGN